MAKYEISKTDILNGTFECNTVEIDSYEMAQNILPKYMNDTRYLIDIWIYDDKTGKKMLYASTNKDRDMSNITKENPICFGYGIHWWVICIVKIIRFIVNTIFLLCSKCMLHIII